MSHLNKIGAGEPSIPFDLTLQLYLSSSDAEGADRSFPRLRWSALVKNFAGRLVPTKSALILICIIS